MPSVYGAKIRNNRALAMMALRGKVQELYDLDLTDDDIAKRVGMHRPYITKIRNELGLPPRWGKRNRHVFSSRHDSNLRELKDTPGLSWTQVAFLLDMPVHVVYARWQMLLTRESTAIHARCPEKVKCRRCKELFVTPDRRQIQMCDACHKRIEQMGSAFDF